MDRKTAKSLSKSLEAAITQLSEALVIAETNLPTEEFANFKHEVGLVIGRLSTDLLDPIYAKHPDLAPPGVL